MIVEINAEKERIFRQRHSDDEIRIISSMQNTAYCMNLIDRIDQQGQSEAPLGSKEIAGFGRNKEIVQ